MRILQISSARQIGGGEKHLIDLAKSLAARGHDLYAVVRPNSALQRELARLLPPQNIKEIPLRNALDIASALQLSRFVRKHKIEILHAHLARDYPLAAFATMRNKSAQFIITRHVLFPLNKLHRWTLASAARVIAVSNAVARALLNSQIVDARKIVVILNGIDTDKFSGKEKPDDKNVSLHQQSAGEPARLLVGTVGQLDALKGHEDFVRAAAFICARNAFVDFVIYGEDASRTSEQRTRLENLIIELKLEKQVRLAGWTNDIASALKAFDVFVSASRNESFGLSIAEAMASGTAVVATMTQGAREIIEDNVTGKLVPVGNIEALASAIDSLLTDKHQRETLGERARKVARERFSLARMIDATEQTYREAVAEKINS